MNNLSLAQLEALLFMHGEPLNFKKAAKLLNAEESQVQKTAQLLAQELTGDNRGLTLIQTGQALQLITKPTHSSLLEQLTKEDLKADLTPAALETLSIIAYSGPISKIEIDYLRGVNSTFVLRSLLLRGLVNRQERGIYQVSFNLLKHLGLTSADQLPDYPKYQQLKEKLKKDEA